MTDTEINRLPPQSLLAILRILKQFVGILEVRTLCAALVDAVVREIGGLHHVSVYLLYRHSGYLSEIAIAGVDSAPLRERRAEGRIQPVSDGILGHVARTGEPYLSGDVTRDPHYLEINANVRSEMCVPIRVDDETIGLINVESPAVDAFSEAELTLFEVLADLVGNGISNSVLHEQVREEEEEVGKARREAGRLGRIYRAMARLRADATITVTPEGKVAALDGAVAELLGAAAAEQGLGRPIGDILEGLPSAEAAAVTPPGPLPVRARAAAGAAPPRAGLTAQVLPLLDERRRPAGSVVLLHR